MVQMVWTCILCISGSYGQLLDYIIFAVLVFYILTIVGLFVLRYTRPNAERPYRAIGYPVLPAIYIVMALFIDIVLLRYKPQFTWPGLIIVLLGIPVYFAWSRRSTGDVTVSLSCPGRNKRMANLFATKSLTSLLEEAKETGEHSLKRTLGVFQLTALGVGAVIGAGIFVMSGLGASYGGAGTDVVIRPFGIGLRVCSALLCRVRGHDSAGRQRLHLCLRNARRIVRLDHRMGPDARICHGRQHGFFGMVEPLHRAAGDFPYPDAALAGLRPLDGTAHRGRHDRPPNGVGVGFHAGSGNAGFPDQGCRRS